MCSWGRGADRLSGEVALLLAGVLTIPFSLKVSLASLPSVPGDADCSSQCLW